MSAGVKTKALAAFVQQCLDPLPDAVLIDTHHNQLMRQARRLPWRKADAVTSLARAETAYWQEKSIHAMYVLEDEDRSSAYSDKRMISVDRSRQAVADQIRVPAPDLLAVQKPQRTDTCRSVRMKSPSSSRRTRRFLQRIR
ncbi:hypothetical protein, partial [Mesorhizobium sp.]|uniref:hypothetical protein n=1 Tax=Mesorhizobium sp. TaxID=1871066 RepID=UPI0011FC64F3